MITVECFGRKMCQDMGGGTPDAYRAVCQALPYALKQICDLLQVSGELDHLGTGPVKILDDSLMNNYTKALPEDAIISNTLTRVLNSESQQDLQCLSEGHLISDLPLVQLYLCSLAQSCDCESCQSTNQTHALKPQRHLICEKDNFLIQMAWYTADILALSVFQNPETLLLPIGNQFSKTTGPFEAAVSIILNSGEPAVCGATAILAKALTLVGHPTESAYRGEWVISCSKGQAVYPKIFETGAIHQPGYLMLYWAPGLLFFSGETYDRGIDPWDPWQGKSDPFSPVLTQMSPPVTRPLNMAPNMKMEWKVARCDGYLEISPTCGQSKGNAFRLLMNLGKSLILRRCPHDSASPLEKPDALATYWGPFFGYPVSSEAEARVDVVAVDGDAGLRMFAMSTIGSEISGLGAPVQTVIRSNSCLQCCLDLCRRAECHYLIC